MSIALPRARSRLAQKISRMLCWGNDHSTGRTTPANLTEQVAMTRVRSAPAGTKVSTTSSLMAELAALDPAWPVSSRCVGGDAGVGRLPEDEVAEMGSQVQGFKTLASGKRSKSLAFLVTTVML